MVAHHSTAQQPTMGVNHADSEKSVPYQVGTCVGLQHVRVMLVIITPARVLLGLPVALVQLAAQPPPPLCCLLHINKPALLKRRANRCRSLLCTSTASFRSKVHICSIETVQNKCPAAYRYCCLWLDPSQLVWSCNRQLCLATKRYLSHGMFTLCYRGRLDFTVTGSHADTKQKVRRLIR